MSHPLVVDGKRKHGLGPNVCELVHNLRHIFGPAAAGTGWRDRLFCECSNQNTAGKTEIPVGSWDFTGGE